MRELKFRAWDIEVYAPHENKELVKRENKRWTYKRHLIKV
mgnify:CR=1 FL=1